MRKLLPALLLLALTSCGQPAASQQAAAGSDGAAGTLPMTQPERPVVDGPTTAVSAGKDRADTAELVFFLEGQEETASAALYCGDGWSIYIPDQGWIRETDIDDGIPEVQWESVDNDDVELTVYRYEDRSLVQAKEAFARSEDYVFEDLLGGGLGDPLTGVDEDGDYLCFMAEEKDGVTFVIAWGYPAEAAEGFGARLRTIADTFQIS